MKLFVGVKAFIVKDSRVLLIREAKYNEGTEEGKWDIPGGRIEPEETLMEGLSREVMEEVGLTVTSTRIVDVHETFREKNGEKWHIVRIYYRGEAEGEVVLGKDHNAYEWLDIKNLDSRTIMEDVRALIEADFQPISDKRAVW